MRLGKWVWPLPALLLLSGCRDERIIEKVGFARSIAFDTAGDEENDQMKITMTLPSLNQKAPAIYTAEAKSARQAILEFDRQSDRRIVNGQLRQALFGLGLAGRGIWGEVNALMRDPSVGMRTHILLVDGSPEKLLSAKYNQENSPGEYVDNLIRTETRTADIPDTNMHAFARDYYDDGIEPVASILKQMKTSIIVDGIALFRGGRYVGRINADEKMFFGMLRGHVQSGNMFLEFPGEGPSSEFASFQYFTSRCSMRIERQGTIGEGEGLRVRITLTVLGSLLEYKGNLHLEQTKDQLQLKGEISRYIADKCEAMIRVMQEYKADAIGVGQRMRNSMPYREWKKLDWPETFSHAKIEVQVHAKIRNFGTVQ